MCGHVSKIYHAQSEMMIMVIIKIKTILNAILNALKKFTHILRGLIHVYILFKTVQYIYKSLQKVREIKRIKRYSYSKYQNNSKDQVN